MKNSREFWTEMESRKIKDIVVKLNWTANDDGVKIPYYDPLTGNYLGNRWWAYGTNRTWGYEGKHKDATVYYTPLTQWLPQMYLVEGETSLAAMYSSGITNSVAIWGVSSTSGLANLFYKKNVFRVVMICDNDDAGIRGAVRVRTELSGSGIYFEAVSIDKYVGNKGDVGDLLQITKNKEMFGVRVKYAPQIHLPLPKGNNKLHVSYDTGDYPDVDEGIIKRIVEECLRRTATENPPVYNGNMKMRSPLREDRNPSFVLNIHTGVAFDHSTSQGWSPSQLSEELGLVAK